MQPHLLQEMHPPVASQVLLGTQEARGQGQGCGAIPRKRGRSAKNWVMVAIRFSCQISWDAKEELGPYGICTPASELSAPYKALLCLFQL